MTHQPPGLRPANRARHAFALRRVPAPATVVSLALVTGSLTPLLLLVADMVVMWATATLRHAHAPPGLIAT
jgi:hypothetical protein